MIKHNIVKLNILLITISAIFNRNIPKIIFSRMVEWQIGII